MKRIAVVGDKNLYAVVRFVIAGLKPNTPPLVGKGRGDVGAVVKILRLQDQQ